MKLTQADLRLVRDRILAIFTPEELEEGGWLDRTPNKEFRIQLAELDMEFFAKFYLGHHFTKPFAPMHHTLIGDVQKAIGTPGRRNEVFLLPRGFGKTTIVTLVFPAWCTVLNKRRHILIISDSHDQAKEQLGTLKDELEFNDRILQDFGSLKGPKWQESEIVTDNGVKISALGARMKVRGRKFRQWRPDLIILDDIENLVAVQSPTQRASLQAWFTQSVMRAGWDDTKVFMVGNMLHFDCLLAKQVANPLFQHRKYKALVSWPSHMNLWDKWRDIITDLAITTDKRIEAGMAFYNEHLKEMLEGATSAWPEAFPVLDLMSIRISEGEASFAMELQNEPVDPSKRTFKSWAMYYREIRHGVEWLVPCSGAAAVELSSCALFAFTDPSLGKTQKSDYSAIIIIAKATTSLQFVLEADIQRRTPEAIWSDQIVWMKKYPQILQWGIETNVFQALMATETARRSLEANNPIPVMSVNQQANKMARIQTLQPDFENRYVLLNKLGQELLKMQLEQWPMGAHDDGPDALEACRNLARNHEPLDSQEIVQGDTYDFSAEDLMKLGQVDPWQEYDDAAVGMFNLIDLERIAQIEDLEERQQAIDRYILRLARERSQEVFVPVTRL